jgi:predicted ester cyclase
MSMDANKALARRSLMMWASGNAERPEDVFAATYVNHQEPDIAGGVSAIGLAEWKALVAVHHAAFAPCEVEIRMQIAEGDLVATRWEFSGTHTGEYLGAAPSGRKVAWTGIEIDRIENGRIVESWVDWDKYRQFQGVGLIA